MVDTLDQDILEFCINHAYKFGAEYAEARIQEQMNRAVILKNSELQPVSIENSYGIGIRIVYNGFMTFVASNDIRKESLSHLIENAVKRSRVKALSKSSNNRIHFNNQYFSSSINWEAKEKTHLTNIDIETIYKNAKELDSLIGNKSLNVKFPSKILILYTSEESKIYTNNNGAFIRSKVPRVGLTCFFTGLSEIKTAQRVLDLGRSGGWESIKELQLHERLTEESIIVAKIVKENGENLNGIMDAVLGPEISGIMAHESVGHPFEADRIIGRESAQAGESYLKPEDIGTLIGSTEANVSDDPTIPGSFGFYVYDDEGVHSKKRQLMKEGIVKELLHNRATAYEFNTVSNGSSRSVRYDREPIIRMANTYVEPGNYSFDELISGVKKGVYIKSFMEWNIDDKRENQRYVGLEAYEITDGEIKGLVKNPVLELTTHQLWSSLDARGKDLHFSAATCGKGDPIQGAPVWTGGPHIRLRNVKISSR